jgi:carnitine O-acetyltransferase
MFALTKFRGNPADQPKTFSRQSSLPKLPIPPLEETFARYLRSLEPIFLQAEELGQLPKGVTAAQELEKRKKWAHDALQQGTLVNKLQQRLHDVDRTSPNNWLDDRFWLQKAYHEWRVPLLINSNWWLMFRADADTPAAVLENPATKAERSGLGLPSESLDEALGANTWQDAEWGIRRATWLVYRLLLFKKRLDDEDIMPDASRAGAFCMHQYTRVFGVTRIPAIPHDFNTEAKHPISARHITVMARNNIYAVDVIDSQGQIISLPQLEQTLTSIVAEARRANGQPVGVLTAAARDDWARAREQLLSVSSRNRQSINSIEDSLFVLALDSSVLPLPTDHPTPAHSCTPDSVDAHARNCSGAGRGGQNRWFDKALTLVVESNGRAGIMGEHSPCDALIPSIVGEFAVAVPAPKPSEKLSDEMLGTAKVSTDSSSAYKKIEFDLDSATKANIDAAYGHVRQICGESDIGELWFDEYGTDWIKKVAKQSPDAYIQQALQLAMSKVKGYQTPTYETASTRMFAHGRTDVIRSFSRESYEFVRAVREKKPASEVYKLLSAATTAHNQQTRASSMGKGIDRHLTGLRLLYDASEDGNLPSSSSTAEAVLNAVTPSSSPKKSVNFYAGAELLFADPVLGESQTWKLSTSGLSAGNLLAGTGFGTGFADGYGTNYLTGSHLLKFGLESKHPAPLGAGELGQHPTNTMARAVVEALRYMRELCEREAPPSSEGSKL